MSVLYCTHLCMKCSLGISNFLKRSLFFPTLLFSCISLHCSLKKALLSILAILWNSAFSWHIFPFCLCLSLRFFSQIFVPWKESYDQPRQHVKKQRILNMRPHGLEPARLFCPWDFPGKNTGVSYHLTALSGIILFICLFFVVIYLFIF